jgi:glycosyltransferase involved in cell wall biosynthesis
MLASPAPEISIIVCTRDRCESLRATLEALLGLDTRDLNYEVLVVDNGSVDQTSRVVSELSERASGVIRYLYQPIKGLSHSRNFGIQHAHGTFIAFTDDDCRPAPNWIRDTERIFRENRAAAVAGRVLIPDELALPGWIRKNKDIFWGPLALCDRGTSIYQLSGEEKPEFVGANMTFHRDVFSEFGVFQTDLGRGSGSLGEDSEFFERLHRAQMPIWYCGSSVVWHHLDPSRLTISGISRWYLLKVQEILRRAGADTPLRKVFCLVKIAGISIVKVISMIGRQVGLR